MQDAETLKKPSLRKPTDNEKREIYSVLNSASSGLPAGYRLLIHELRYREVLAFTQEETMFLAETISNKKNVYFAGIFAGSFRKDKFKLSLDLVEHLYRRGYWTNYVILEENHSKSFLYGRNVENGFLKLVGRGVVLVLNSEKDVIGLGLIGENSEKLVNLVDKGWYLRKGH
jgi:ribosome biogenesis protein Nip4